MIRHKSVYVRLRALSRKYQDGHKKCTREQYNHRAGHEIVEIAHAKPQVHNNK